MIFVELIDGFLFHLGLFFGLGFNKESYFSTLTYTSISLSHLRLIISILPRLSSFICRITNQIIVYPIILTWWYGAIWHVICHFLRGTSLGSRLTTRREIGIIELTNLAISISLRWSILRTPSNFSFKLCSSIIKWSWIWS